MNKNLDVVLIIKQSLYIFQSYYYVQTEPLRGMVGLGDPTFDIAKIYKLTMFFLQVNIFYQFFTVQNLSFFTE